MTTRNTPEPGAAQVDAAHPAQANPAALYGALLAGVGVALGAFGAHALKASLSAEMLGVFETGVRYQMYSGLGLVALGAMPISTGPISTGQLSQPAGRRAPQLLLAGTVIFSGSLYALALSNVRWLGAVTPIGGVLMILGWGLVAWNMRGKGRRT